MAVCKRLLLLCYTSWTLRATPHSSVWDGRAAAVHAPAQANGVPALNGRVLAPLVTLRLASAQKVLHRGCLLLAFGHHRSWVKIWNTRWKTTRKRFILARQSGKSSWIKWQSHLVWGRLEASAGPSGRSARTASKTQISTQWQKTTEQISFKPVYFWRLCGCECARPDLPGDVIHLTFQGKQVGDEGAVELRQREVLQEKTWAQVRRQTVTSAV